MKHLFVILLVLISTSATAAPMVRVVGIASARTLIVDRNGVAAEVALADIAMNPVDEPAAVEYLRAKLVGAWVLVETNREGKAYVYRSPDAFFVNGALSRRAYLDRGPEMIYLGEAQPGPARAAANPKTSTNRTRLTPPPKPRRARTSPKGAHRIPKTE